MRAASRRQLLGQGLAFRSETQLAAGRVDIMAFLTAQSGGDALTLESGKKCFLD